MLTHQIHLLQDRRGALLLHACVALLVLLTHDGLDAQPRATYSQGQVVWPAFEGWTENPDGSFNIVFGYMNRNWENEVHVPVGPDNHISPGPSDQGQPTRLLPRRNRFVFEVRVPPDFGDQELVWTLTTQGDTLRAYGSLHRDYKLSYITIMSETGALGGGGSGGPELRANVPPVIEQVDGGTMRSARVGEPLTLAARVTDEGQFESRGFRGATAPDPDATPQDLLERALVQPVGATVNKAVGLHFTWFVYRGEGRVSFDPVQIKTWEDTRPFANSPWSPFWVPPPVPEDDMWVAEVTFHDPGTYVLRGRADDGGLYADVEVTVQVTP